jgi:hypothetical protein
MSYDAHKNFVLTSIATAPVPSTSGTSLIVAGNTGTIFPATPFNAVIWPANAVPTAASAEIVRVTGITGDTLTIVRQQEGSAARAIVHGDFIAQAVTAKTVQDIEDVIPAVFNVQAYGALGNDTANDTVSLQSAIDAAGVAGGIVFVPEGKFRHTGITVSSSTGVTIRGTGPGSILISNTAAISRPILITGSKVDFEQLCIDGRYVSGGTSDVNLFYTSNASDVTISRCYLKNSAGRSLGVFGDSQFITIKNSRIDNCYCSIYSYPDNANNKIPQFITIRDNEIRNNWDRSGNDQTGGIKLSVGGSITIQSKGHRIIGNRIHSAGCLSIELWGGGGVMSDSIIDHNYVSDAGDGAEQFGISMNDCRDVLCHDNVVRLTNGYFGIEAANECQRVSIIGNSVNMLQANNATPSSSTRGISVNHNVEIQPQWTQILNNNIVGVGDCIYIQDGWQTIVNGNQCSNFTNSFLTTQNASSVEVKHNRISSDCSAFVILFGVNANIGDIEIAYNTFVGDCGFFCFWGYNNGSIYTLTNLNFHHNDGNLSTFSGYGTWWLGWDTVKMANIRRLNNFYVAGSGKADLSDWTSPDIPSGGPFTPAIQKFSIPIAAQFTFAVPASSGEQWFKILSANYGYPLTMALHVECDFLASDNQASSQTFWVSGSPYGQGAGVMKMPDGWYQGGALASIIYNNPSAGAIHEIWIHFTATGAGTVTIGGADFATNWILVPAAVTSEPTWNANSYKLDAKLDQGALKSRFIATDVLSGNELAASPDAPPANGYKIYAKDVGGKTAIFARFATGAEQQIKIEP